MAPGRIPRIDAVVPHGILQGAYDVPSSDMDVAGRRYRGIYHARFINRDGPRIHEATEVQLLEAESEPPVPGYAHQKPYRVAGGDDRFPEAAMLPFELGELLGIAVFSQNIVEGSRGDGHHLQVA